MTKKNKLFLTTIYMAIISVLFCSKNTFAYKEIQVDQSKPNSTQICSQYLNQKEYFLEKMKSSNTNKNTSNNVKNLPSNIILVKPKPLYFGTQKEVLERKKQIREYEQQQKDLRESQKQLKNNVLTAEEKENQIRINQCLQS